MNITVRAPAKINLHLGVGAPREDGFHSLMTVYQAVGICDDVSVSRSAAWTLRVSVPEWIDPDLVPLGGDNIVDRAASLLAAHHGVDAKADVLITKSIPVAGGMAGGSADAAAALVALDRLWGLETSDADLLRIAADLGSDVPFALLGGTALGTGHGELVEQVEDAATWWWVAVVSDEGMSTPAVYRHFDVLNPDAPVQPESPDALLAALASGDPLRLGETLHNDLQEAAIDLRPDLGDIIDFGHAVGAVRGIVSGSGPTCVFLAESADAAREVAAAFGKNGHEVVLVTPGPVAGAHVVTY
ncbi:4-(cytidine 5'-diphospho)-2-C-methyl-D-erythritol kinase [Nocardioides sp.]|uniref:4-(cytidine 5'-diphospho)-2-C-methyl-D-erythritol kinase n=1 Tax=Nocardioides sp. TaxID=35761 RepID=UPI00356AC0D5